MKSFQKRIDDRHGFTIVELLIVIVVIAILAAIGIVTYNGIQQRANNISRIANAQNAVKLVTAYVAAYDTYPLAGNSCVGNGFANNNTKCWGIDSATPTHRNASLNETELAKIGSLPNNMTPPVQTASWKGLGPVYTYGASRTVDDVVNPVIILYFLEGTSQDCGLPNVVTPTTAGVYNTVTASPRFSSNTGNATVCQVYVPTS